MTETTLVQEFLVKYQFLLKDSNMMECADEPVSIIDVDVKEECGQDNQTFMVRFEALDC